MVWTRSNKMASSSTQEQQQQQLKTPVPHVIVAGGGPAGLLAAILLGQQTSIPSITVLERAAQPDEWSTKSHSIVLGATGMGSLGHAVGVAEAVRAAGIAREVVILHDGATGQHRAIPKKVPGVGLSRPGLVTCLEAVAQQLPSVTIRRGSKVTGVSRTTATNSETGDSKDASTNLAYPLEVSLEDGSVVRGTHVIGADGKWSAIRNSLLAWDNDNSDNSNFDTQKNTMTAQLRTLPTYGVHLLLPGAPADDWATNGTHVLQPKSPTDAMFYIIAAPLPTGEFSVTIVCYDETAARYPWLAPPDEKETRNETSGDTWEYEYSAALPGQPRNQKLAEHLGPWLSEHVPHFAALLDAEALATARINRRVTWLDMSLSSEATTATSNNSNDDAPGVDGSTFVRYSTLDGRVALIGDAAHAMPPTMGEGCNTALESAVKLVAPLLPCAGGADADTTTALPSTMTTTTTVEKLSDAFGAYGLSRPRETQPVQIASAQRAKWSGGASGGPPPPPGKKT